MATQIILWEYQQQLRSDPYSRHGNGHADADQYFSVIAGRPAEKAYDWILAQVASIPQYLPLLLLRKAKHRNWN